MRNRQAEIVKQMDDRELVYHLYLSQLIFFIIAAVLSFFFFQSLDEFWSIWTFDAADIFVIGSLAGIIVVSLDLILIKFVPKHFIDDGGINEKLFQKRSVAHIVFLAFIIAAVEEFLFRGVIQTHFGIWIASIVFALLHIRYLYKWILLTSVIVLSFLLGLIYVWTESILVTIWAHFLIDLLLALKIRYDYINSVMNDEVGEENE